MRISSRSGPNSWRSSLNFRVHLRSISWAGRGRPAPVKSGQRDHQITYRGVFVARPLGIIVFCETQLGVLHLCSVSVLYETQSENSVVFYRQNVVLETQFL
jgi:hypothetical protein